MSGYVKYKYNNNKKNLKILMILQNMLHHSGYVKYKYNKKNS